MAESIVEQTLTRLRAHIDDLMTRGLDKLPPERTLAQMLGVSRGSLRKALAALEADGIITRSLGRTGGSYIRRMVEAAPVHTAMFELRSSKLIRDLNHISGVPQMLSRQGRTSSTRIVNAAVEPAEANVSTLLGITPGDEVVSLLRVRLSDGEPWSLERMYLPAARFPGFLDRGGVESVYRTLERVYGVTVDHFEEHVEVTPTDSRVSVLLGVSVGAPLFALRRVARDDQGVPVETSVDFFRADRTRLRFSGRFDGLSDDAQAAHVPSEHPSTR